jgi:hypothetical protein
MMMKLRQSMFQLVNEVPRAAEEQANSIMGLEADVCGIQATLKKMEEEMWRIQ